MTPPDIAVGTKAASAGGEPWAMRAVDADEHFFSAYEWSLNPYQSLRELLGHLGEELQRGRFREAGWQREESRVNIYLLLAAASCAISDFLAPPRWDLSTVASRAPKLRKAISIAEASLRVTASMRPVRNGREIRRCQRALEICLDRSSADLVSRSAETSGIVLELRSALKSISSMALPRALLDWRSSIPEAFRCQDMTHHDAVAMARGVTRRFSLQHQPVLVTGPRTAGTYFAPLIAASLAAQGIPTVGWMTFRPKHGATREEQRRFRELMKRAPRVLIVDDHPNTGRTLSLMVSLLERLGAARENMVIVAPDHPAQGDWTRGLQSLAISTLPSSELHKYRLMNDRTEMESLLRDLYRARGWDDIRLEESPEVDAVNSGLTARFGGSFEVRLKRVFQLALLRGRESPVTKRVLAKSVGWGWLGYHAYLAGTRLAGFVPPTIGLRDGLILTEWVDSPKTAPWPATAITAQSVAAYVAARARRLPVAPAASFEGPRHRKAGADMLLRVLANPYGRTVGRLKRRLLKARLQKYCPPLPILVDGRMSRDEWVEDDSGLYKTDFEHHNFGGAQPDIVDPAYDLASAVYELELSEAAERDLIEAYVRQTGDVAVSRRLLLNKLLAGVLAMEHASYFTVRGHSRDRQEFWNRRYTAARSFLTDQMSRHCASRLKVPASPNWSGPLLFLDLDGVFDWEFFGPYFPHTTPSGLMALELLRSHGYSVALNTGRSVRDVRNYCRTYALPGGVAEYGAVFVDVVRNVEQRLFDAETDEQLQRCRARIGKLAGAFMDPNYECSVRAYRYDGLTTVGLNSLEVAELIERAGLHRLDAITREADTYVVPKCANKGTALEAVRRHFPSAHGPVVAIGDSLQDVAMLRAADIAYMPSNCPKVVRELLQGRKYRVMRRPVQRGLLDAVRELTGAPARAGDRCPDERALDEDFAHLVDAVLHAAEQSRFRRLLGLLRRRIA